MNALVPTARLLLVKEREVSGFNVSETPQSHGNDSEARSWTAYELKPRDFESRFFACELGNAEIGGLTPPAVLF